MIVPGSDIPDAATARRYLRDAAAALADAIPQPVARWCRNQIAVVVDAWGGLDGPAADACLRQTGVAATDAAAEAAARMRRLAERDPLQPGAPGPLDALAGLEAYPAAVLRAAGIAEIERDAFEERTYPDDVYGLRIMSLRDLPGGDSLVELQLTWGVAKAALVRAVRGSLYE